jgi:hypothetical protein
VIARRAAAVALAGALCAAHPAAAGAEEGAAGDAPDVARLLEQSAAARGGLEAWRRVQTMAWTGHVERADGSGPRVPFSFQQKRPNLTRFEIQVDRQPSVRVFDGRRGWKLRPGAGGRPVPQPYGDEEVQAARDALVIDGPLLDAAAKGVRVTLEGPDEVEGKKAWRLRAQLPSGTAQRVWIDAQSFLEVKYDRPARDLAGRPTTVAVYLRNYQAHEGLQIPTTIETGAPGGGPTVDRLVIERVDINPILAEGTFTRADPRPSRRGGVTVDARARP